MYNLRATRVLHRFTDAITPWSVLSGYIEGLRERGMLNSRHNPQLCVRVFRRARYIHTRVRTRVHASADLSIIHRRRARKTLFNTDLQYGQISSLRVYMRCIANVVVGTCAKNSLGLPPSSPENRLPKVIPRKKKPIKSKWLREERKRLSV